MPVTETPRASEQATLATALIQGGESSAEVQSRLVERFGIRESRARQIISAARKAMKAAGIAPGGKRPPTPGPRAIVDHPPPPEDALAGVDWVLARMIAATDRIIRCGELTAKQELEELRKTAKACASLLNPERIYKAEQKLDKRTKKLGTSRKEAKLTDAGPVAPQPDHANPRGDGGNIRLSSD